MPQHAIIIQNIGSLYTALSRYYEHSIILHQNFTFAYHGFQIWSKTRRNMQCMKAEKMLVQQQ
jgi:hypothetical protein